MKEFKLLFQSFLMKDLIQLQFPHSWVLFIRKDGILKIEILLF